MNSISHPEGMKRTNEREVKETFFKGKHLKFDELRRCRIQNGYLYNTIPRQPEYVEFRVSNLKHDTNLEGYHGIWKSSGFKKPPSNSPNPDGFDHTKNLVWWSPHISGCEIAAAEKQYLEDQRYGYEVKPFLHKFTSSPAFLPSSRLGNFRFTMPIQVLLKSYEQQLCKGHKPHIRKFETVVYKQEVMYSIVVHAPHEQHLFSEYPLLKNTQDAMCEFHEDSIIWRPQAISQTHRFRLSQYMEAVLIPRKKRKFYVWDNIGVAFHVPHGQIFQFSETDLTKSLRLCEGALPKNNPGFVKCEFGPIKPNDPSVM